MADREELTLSQLAAQIKDTLETAFDGPLWVIAEVNRATFRNHVYLDLVEKAENSDEPVAQMRAMIWRSYVHSVVDKFELMTGKSFMAGLKILVKGYVTYHPRYGLGFDIRDIDPYYTLGDLYRRKQEVIRQLKEEGVFDMNRNLPLPLVIQRIAVISSETAAGYEDFVNHLKNNVYGFVFYHKLFKAYVQGAQAEQSIIDALDRIYKVHEDFDVVVIIRGGGSKTDLGVFDSYQVAANVAQFPLPVITGIGHTRDESVVDMVANLSLKTPTAVADFIVEHAAEFLGNLVELHERLLNSSQLFISAQRMLVMSLEVSLREQVKTYLWKRRYGLEQINSHLNKVIKLPSRERQNLLLIWQRLMYAQSLLFDAEKRTLSEEKKRLLLELNNLISREKNNLEKLNLKIENNDPKKVLSRGYSITLHNGKALKNTDSISEGDTLETILYHGRIKSQIIAKENDSQES